MGLFMPRKGRLWWLVPATAIAVGAIALTVDFQALFAEGGERFTLNSLIGRETPWVPFPAEPDRIEDFLARTG